MFSNSEDVDIYAEYKDNGWCLYEPTVEFGDLTLPGLSSFMELEKEPPETPEEVIQGVLRKGRKMLLSGPSKAAKSCLLMELGIAIAEGRPWLGFPCRKGKVLYVNLEIDKSTFYRRLIDMYDTLGIEHDKDDSNFDSDDPYPTTDDFKIWNLRGFSNSLDTLCKPISYICREEKIDVLIIDPIYKVLTGDENNAGDIGQFCNQLDWIIDQTGCAVIFSHHHSKGAKGNRQVLDRSSGSGVFARDPDTILDLIQLDPPKSVQEQKGPLYSAWRMEAVLREFPSRDPVNLWFHYPIHELDTEGLLDQAGASGTPQSNLQKSSKFITREEREAAFHQAFNDLSKDGAPVKVAAMAKKMKVTQQTVRNRYEELKDHYWLDSGLIIRKNCA